MKNADFKAFAEQFLDQARALTKHYQATSFSRQATADRSLVTEADLAIEERLRAMIKQTYPSHGIYGEELPNLNPKAEYQWLIDPIDGTNAFIAGIPTYTTLLVDRVTAITIPQSAGGIFLGGDAYLFAKAALGKIDIIIEENLKPHDFVPLLPIIKGAGLTYCNWQGEENFSLSEKTNLIVCRSELRQAILAILRG